MTSASNIQRLDIALSSPSEAKIDDYPFCVRELVYRCWASLLCRSLPDSQIVSLLCDSSDTWHPSIYLTADEHLAYNIPSNPNDRVAHDQLLLDSLDETEIDMYAESLEALRLDLAPQGAHRTRAFIGSVDNTLHAPQAKISPAGIWLDKEFDRLSKWIFELHVVEANIREKHWPPLQIKDHTQLIAHSIKKPDIGWLNIGSDPVQLRHYALAVLATYFFEELRKTTIETEPRRYFIDFLETWERVFNNGSFRLGVTHVQPMGVASGKEANNVVYDFDLSSLQFHCFPALIFPDVLAEFHEGQFDF